MTKFLNKKEQVIDFQLTTYGRRKLAHGKLKPTYYSFYDDGVIYDSKFAGFDEEQNDIHKRIKENTSYLQGILSFEEIENSTPPGNYLEVAYEDATSMSDFDFDPAPDKNILQTNKFVFDGAIGDAAFEGKNTQAAPAWKVLTCQGEILSTSARDTSTYDFTHVELDEEAREFNIPQLEVGLYYTKLIDKPSTPLKYGTVSDSVTETQPFNDGYSVKLVRDDMVIYAEEMNTQLFTENFDIEVFEMIELGGSEKLSTATITVNAENSNDWFGITTGGGKKEPVTITIHDGIKTTTFELVTDGTDPENDEHVGVVIANSFTYIGLSNDSITAWGILYNLMAAIDKTFDNSYPTPFDEGTAVDGSVLENTSAFTYGRCARASVDSGIDGQHNCVRMGAETKINVSVGDVPPPVMLSSERKFTLTNLNLGKNGTITTNFPSGFTVTDFKGGVSFDVTELKRKFFEKEIPHIVDGLMTSMTPDEGLEPELTDDAVEYYFDVLTDTSVDAKIACECASTFNKNSYYIDIDFDEEECKKAGEAEEMELYFDIYGSVTEPEVCASDASPGTSADFAGFDDVAEPCEDE